MDFSGCSDDKESASSAGSNLGLIPQLERSSGRGNGNPSRILVWRIPWTEEPGGLQSTGSQRVGHDWSDLAGNITLVPTLGVGFSSETETFFFLYIWNFGVRNDVSTTGLLVLFNIDSSLSVSFCFSFAFILTSFTLLGWYSGDKSPFFSLHHFANRTSEAV